MSDVETIELALSRLDVLESDHRLRLRALNALKDMGAQLDEMTAQQRLLVSACKLAMEWAAGYPLGSGIDKLAAGEVYNACECALLMKGDTPNA